MSSLATTPFSNPSPANSCKEVTAEQTHGFLLIELCDLREARVGLIQERFELELERQPASLAFASMPRLCHNRNVKALQLKAAVTKDIPLPLAKRILSRTFRGSRSHAQLSKLRVHRI